MKDIRWKVSVKLRLVAQHFIPNPLNLPCVLHKVETLDENWVLYNGEDNLYWWTHSDNMKDMQRKWRSNGYFKWKFWVDNPKSKPINQYALDKTFIKVWKTIRQVERELWIANSSITKCCNWKLKTSGGFIWKYV